MSTRITHLFFSILSIVPPIIFIFFFFNDTATTEIYTLSLHDALPICSPEPLLPVLHPRFQHLSQHQRDRKSTRLNSSHSQISYAVFCLKKKKKPQYKSDYTKTATIVKTYTGGYLMYQHTFNTCVLTYQ